MSASALVTPVPPPPTWQRLRSEGLRGLSFRQGLLAVFLLIAVALGGAGAQAMLALEHGLDPQLFRAESAPLAQPSDCGDRKLSDESSA